jgi:hypothetical protein
MLTDEEISLLSQSLRQLKSEVMDLAAQISDKDDVDIELDFIALYDSIGNCIKISQNFILHEQISDLMTERKRIVRTLADLDKKMPTGLEKIKILIEKIVCDLWRLDFRSAFNQFSIFGKDPIDVALRFHDNCSAGGLEESVAYND